MTKVCDLTILEHLNDGDLLVLHDGERKVWSQEYYELMTGKAREESIFTRNCGARLVCGRLGSVASRMALDDQQACTIDGKRKGAGIIKSQGEVAHIQYYFEEQKWIKQWFTARGLTEKGYMPSEDPSAAIDPEKIDFGEDEDLHIERSKTEIEFTGIHREVDHTQDQHFEEV